MAPEPRNYTSQNIMRPRNVFRVIPLLAQMLSGPEKGSLASAGHEVASTSRRSPLIRNFAATLSSSYRSSVFGARLPRTVFSQMPCVRAVTLAVCGPMTLPRSSRGHVFATTVTAAVMCITRPRRTQDYQTRVRALRTETLNPGKKHSSDPPPGPEALLSL